jgi:putative chitinase
LAFINALYNLWPDGDKKVPGLRDGIADLAAVFAKYGPIDTPLLVAHVMAQISHECGAGRDVVENMNYTAQRITQVWPSRFPTQASAAPFSGNPRALANKVYNGRMGNRMGLMTATISVAAADRKPQAARAMSAWRKRPRSMSSTIPTILIDPRFFLECAVSDFINCGCLPAAKADDIFNVTKKLNGGTIGLDDRVAWLVKWK